MARTKEFDPDDVLRKATDLFWQQGYEATSMADLVEHLGIGRASIYATFGGKRDLYAKALAGYVQAKDPDIVAMLSQPGPVIPAVRALVDSVVETSLSDSRRRGCMVVNAAVEGMARDRELARRIEGSWDALETALTAALIRARVQGEIPAEREPRALARLLLVLMQGIRVMGRAHPEPGRLRDAATTALALLD